MNIRLKVFTIVLLCQFIFYTHGVSSSEGYLDDTLPKTIKSAPYKGIRYKIEIPDTVELVDHAHHAINALTRLLDPEHDYEQYTCLFFDSNPPVGELGHGGLLNLNPKWLEALPMLRVMTGSTFNIDVDDKLMGSLLHVTGKDGLCYQPIENRPWAFFENVTRDIGKPYADIFGEGRQLLAYAAWYQHDRNPLWKKLMEKKIHRLQELALEKDNTYYFRLARGYTPGDSSEGPVIPIADHTIADVEQGMTGSPATYIIGFFPQAGSHWYRLTGSQAALEFASKTANYLVQHGEVLDPDTGRILADHPTHVSHSLLSNLSYAISVNDQEMIDWVRKGHEDLLKTRDPDHIGIVEAEAGSVGDQICLDIMLSQAGQGDYWDDADRWIRNTFLDLQMTDLDWFRDKHPVQEVVDDGIYVLENGRKVDYSVGDEYRRTKAFRQFHEGADSVVGSWWYAFTNMTENPGLGDNLGCCTGNCSRQLYYIWDNIVTVRDDKLSVNLLYNHPSKWTDVASYLPYEGKIELSMKKSMDVSVRIPDWVERDKLRCELNGHKHEISWSGNRINLGKIEWGDSIDILFPMKTRKFKTTVRNQQAEVTMKGNTIIDVVPARAYPVLHKHKKYAGDKVEFREVTRFVSEERFIW
jgi:hypothetical protein